MFRFAHIATIGAVTLSLIACGESGDSPEVSPPAVDVGILPDLGSDPDVQAVPDFEFDLLGDSDVSTDAALDETPPALSFASPIAGGVVSGEILQVTLIASDASGIDSLQVWLSGEDLGQTQEVPYEFVILAEDLPSGTYTLDATAVDGAGNRTAASVTFEFEQPCASPPCVPVEVRWLSPRDVDSICRTVGFEVFLLPQDVVESVEYTLDGDLLGSSEAPPWRLEWESREVPDGTYELIATSMREDGRRAFASRQLVVANRGQDCALPPEVEFVSPAHGAVFRGLLPIALTLGESAVAATLFVDGAVAAEVEVSRPMLELDSAAYPEGFVELRAVAVDARGRSAESERHVTIDRTPPDLTVLSPFGGTYSETVFLAADLFDAGGVERVDWYDASRTSIVLEGGLASIEGDGPIAVGGTDGRAELALAGWSSGTHDVFAVATDRAGWSAIDTASFVVDRPPSLELVSPIGDVLITGPTVVIVSVDDDAGPVTITLFQGESELAIVEVGDRGIVTDTAEFSWIPAFAEGPTALRIEAVDRSGGLVTLEAEFTVNHAPRLDVTVCVDACGPAEELAEWSDVLLLRATTSDDGGPIERVELTIDGALFATDAAAPFDFEWDTTVVDNGSHELRLRAITDDDETGEWSRIVTVAN
ncbi:MAG: hypothetical protein ACJAYU_003181 [Bradymonadia bacterium]